jgi:hypothetical protein
LGTGGSRGAAGGSVGARRGTICGRLTEEEVDKACAECLGYRVGVRGVWWWDRGLVGLGLWCGGATAELRCFGLTWCRGQLDGIDFVALVEAETDDLPPVDPIVTGCNRIIRVLLTWDPSPSLSSSSHPSAEYTYIPLVTLTVTTPIY